MSRPYVHGYGPAEAMRLQDQAGTLVELSGAAWGLKIRP